MNDFAASNGIKITIRKQESDGKTYLVGKGGQILGGDREWTEATASAEGIDALREFFRAEEDERLGRWRWAGDPSYVVYPKDHYLLVRDELERDDDDSYATYSRMGYGGKFPGRKGAVARAYYQEHPESGPWSDAKPGEVWVLSTTDYPEEAAYTYESSLMGGVYFQRHDVDANSYDLRDPRITSGRRIWPEPS